MHPVTGERNGLTGYHMHLDGLSRPVLLRGGEEMAADLSACLPAWPHRLEEAVGTGHVAEIVRDGERWRVAAPGPRGTTFHDNAVNAVCDLIAALPFALAEDQPDRLNLHAAAVEVEGRLVLIPAVRRSGKSLLTVALARRGAAVFADDVVGVLAREGAPLAGIASGVAPRLRLPLPAGTSKEFQEFVSDHAGPENRQYRYVSLDHQPAFGTTAPFGAVVIPDRQDSGPARLEPHSRADVLKRLLHQHFSRDRASPLVMAALHSLATTTRAWRLVYSRVEEGADAILSAGEDLFGPDSENAPLRLPAISTGSLPRPDRLSESAHYVRFAGADIRELDGECFAVSRDGARIVHLDTGAERLWTLLAEPVSVAEAIGIVCAAFPDADPGSVASHTRATFERFISLGLIEKA